MNNVTTAKNCKKGVLLLQQRDKQSSGHDQFSDAADRAEQAAGAHCVAE